MSLAWHFASSATISSPCAFICASPAEAARNAHADGMATKLAFGFGSSHPPSGCTELAVPAFKLNVCSRQSGVIRMWKAQLELAALQARACEQADLRHRVRRSAQFRVSSGKGQRLRESQRFGLLRRRLLLGGQPGRSRESGGKKPAAQFCFVVHFLRECDLESSGWRSRQIGRDLDHQGVGFLLRIELIAPNKWTEATALSATLELRPRELIRASPAGVPRQKA